VREIERERERDTVQFPFLSVTSNKQTRDSTASICLGIHYSYKTPTAAPLTTTIFLNSCSLHASVSHQKNPLNLSSIPINPKTKGQPQNRPINQPPKLTQSFSTQKNQSCSNHQRRRKQIEK
jgi:hypothetical protein